MKTINTIAFLFLCLNYGCISSTSKTQQYTSKTPWCAAQVKAEVYTRKVTYFMAPKFTTKVTWKNRTKFLNSTISRDKVEKEINDFFYEHSELIKSWPVDNGMSYTHYAYGDITPRKCPYLLFLVSIMPTVIIGIEKPSPDYIQVGHSDDFDSVFSSYLSESTIKVATVLPPSASGWWFAPKISSKFEPLELTKRTSMIRLSKKDKLKIIKHDDGINIIRE